MKNTLDTIVNVVTLATCLVLVSVLIQVRFQPAPQPPGSLSAGEHIDALSRESFSGAQRTVLLALQNNCHFCEESMPFYRSLAQASTRQARGSLQLVVVTTDAAETSATHMQERELSVDRIVSVSPNTMSALKVAGTPTLIVTDRSGVVEAVWVGKLTDRQQAEVMAKLGLTS